MLQFILERANYWAIIGLMMVGLYIAFQSANMIKKLVGLSIFQTSVFFFYITLGKVAGGSAPILYGKDAAGHGAEHGEEHVAAGANGTPVAVHEATEFAEEHEAIEGEVGQETSSESGQPVDGPALDESEELGDGLVDVGQDALEAIAENTGEIDGDILAPDLDADDVIEAAPLDAVGDLLNPLTGLQEVYSNPLPHVLILTAIVVGVATLAVGLAIVVRIREAYGTIEADEVREMDIETADEQDADDRMGVSA